MSTARHFAFITAAGGDSEALAGARLLFVTGTPASVRHGSGTFVGISVLRRALIAAGCEVELIAPPPGPATAARRLWFNYRLRHLDVSRYDACVGFDLDGLWLEGEVPVQAAAIKGVLAEERRYERGWPRLSLGVQARLERRRAQRVDRVIAPSVYAAAALGRHYGIPWERLHVVPEPIDLNAWRQRLAAAVPERRTGPTLLCVAHLYPRKDVATLLRAMARLGTALRLRIVGDGPELARLRALADALGLGERVEFLGHVPLTRLAVEYRSADLFCLPSRQEAFGIVLLEAMAAGLPVVAARAAAIPEVVPEGECGWLFPAGDDEDLAAALERLLNDGAARRRMAAAGRERVEQFDAGRVAAAFAQALFSDASASSLPRLRALPDV